MAGLAAATNAQQASAWLRVTAWTSYATIFSFYHFSLVLSRHEGQPWTRRLFAAGLALAGVDMLGRLLGIIPVQLVHHPTQGWFPSSDPVYAFLYMPVMLVFVLTGMGLLVRRRTQSRSALERAHLGYVFLAFAAGLLLTMMNLVPALAFLAAFSTLAFTGVLAYGITRHQLLGIRFLFRQGLVASGVSAVLAFILALAILIEHHVWGAEASSGIFTAVATALVFTLVYQSLWSIWGRWMDRWLGIPAWDPSAELLAFSMLAGVHPRLDAFLQATAEKIVADLGVERCAFLLPDRDGRFSPIAAHPPALGWAGEAVMQGSALADLLRESPLGLDLDTLEWICRYELDAKDGPDSQAVEDCRRVLADLQCRSLVGLRGSGGLVGILAVGAPSSGRAEGEQQAFLSVLSSQVAVVAENAILQGRVDRADRLSSLGTLAAGLAHELRNPLTSISVFVQMLPERFHDPAFREKFDRLVPHELKKLTRLTEQLLDIARPVPRRSQLVDMAALAERNRQLLAYQFKRRQVRLLVECMDACFVVGVEEELSQVLLNLLLAAAPDPQLHPALHEAGIQRHQRRCRVRGRDGDAARRAVQAVLAVHALRRIGVAGVAAGAVAVETGAVLPPPRVRHLRNSLDASAHAQHLRRLGLIPQLRLLDLPVVPVVGRLIDRVLDPPLADLIDHHEPRQPQGRAQRDQLRRQLHRIAPHLGHRPVLL
jgi:hypothetical protein